MAAATLRAMSGKSTGAGSNEPTSSTSWPLSRQEGQDLGFHRKAGMVGADDELHERFLLGLSAEIRLRPVAGLELSGKQAVAEEGEHARRAALRFLRVGLPDVDPASCRGQTTL
jgi:hypothetical protein